MQFALCGIDDIILEDVGSTGMLLRRSDSHTFSSFYSP